MSTESLLPLSATTQNPAVASKFHSYDQESEGVTWINEALISSSYSIIDRLGVWLLGVEGREKLCDRRFVSDNGRIRLNDAFACS